MNLVSLSENKEKSGAKWTARIYFDPEADSKSGPKPRISDRKLRKKLGLLIKAEEEIQEIWIYSHKLHKLQIVQGLFMFHAFVVLRTESHYWSIEKNSEGITIQRSTELAFVKSKYRREARNTPITIVEHSTGRMKMQNIIDWLYAEDELNKEYNWVFSNCQNFANRLFRVFAAPKPSWFSICIEASRLVSALTSSAN